MLDDEDVTALEDEDLVSLLLDEVTSAGSVTLPLLEEDDSTVGSSFCPADAEELSSHPTKANVIISMDPIAAPFDKLRDQRLQDDSTRNFFINAPY